MKKKYKIEVDCANCAAKCEEAAKKVPGVADANVSFMIQKMQVERTVKYSQWDFAPIPDHTFKFKGDTKLEANAQMRDEEFWDEQRPTPLTKSES